MLRCLVLAVLRTPFALIRKMWLRMCGGSVQKLCTRIRSSQYNVISYTLLK